MKITVVSHSSVVGLYRHKFSLMSRRYNDDISIVTPPSWREGERTVVSETGFYPEIDCTVIPVHWGDRLNRHYYSWQRLSSYLTARKPDIVLIEEEPRSLCAYQVRLLCRFLGIPFIFFTWENIDRRFSPVNELILRSVFRSASGAVAGSWEASEILRKRAFARPVLIQPQYGIDPEFFSRRERSRFREGWRVSGPVIAYAGRLVEEKGIDTLLQAFDKLTLPATCVIAGSGPALPALKELAARLQHSREIYFLGPIPYDQMSEFFSACDILVLPSRTTPKWKEQFGRVLIEAMACGVCVVGSDSGAIPAVIGSAGWIFREKNTTVLSKILNDLVANGDERSRLAEDGRRRAVEHFSNEILSQRLREFFTQVLTGNK